MLAIYTGRGVTPELNLREHISSTPQQSSNKVEPTLALKPRGDMTRSPKQGYQWPHKWTCVTCKQKFKKKKIQYLWNSQTALLRQGLQQGVFLAYEFAYIFPARQQSKIKITS